jgi:PhoD-like phosphatase
LDTRSYRSPNNSIDNSGKSMLGEVQREALLDFLEQSSAAFKVIVSSVPFALGEVSADTWSSYQTERELILAEIEQRGISGVLFLSGDRHWSGAFRFISSGGYAYYDFLPSPAGAQFRTGTAPPVNANPNNTVIYTADNFQVFGDFQIDLAGDTPTLRAAFVDENGNDRCVITIGNNETGIFGAGPVATCFAPETPVLSVSGTTSTQTTLDWNDVTAETGYSLRRSTSASGVLDAASEIAQVGADVTTYTDSNLTPSTTYYYQLVAVYDTQEGASAVVSTTTLPPDGC